MGLRGQRGVHILDPIVPTEEQQRDIDNLLSDTSGAYLDGSEPGSGKTLVSVEYVKQSHAQTVLVIAPLQTKGEPLLDDAPDAEGWWGTFDRQQVGLPFRMIDSTPTGKIALADWEWQVPGVYFVGHEMFARMAFEKVQQFNRDKTPKTKYNKKTGKHDLVFKTVRTLVWNKNPDVIIFDEVHRAQNPDSVTSKALRGGVRGKNSIRGKMNGGLSGTWTGNSFDGAWSVTKWLWPDVIDSSIYVWRAKWATVEYDPFAPMNQKVSGEANPGAFADSLPCYVRRDSNLNIEVIEKEFWVDLSVNQRRVYDEMERQSLMWVEGHPMVAKVPIVKRIRQRQVTLADPILIHADGEETKLDFAVDCDSSKIDAIWEVLDDFFESEPALIYTDSQKFASVLTERINLHYGGPVARKWSGKVTKKVRAANKADYLKGEFKYIVGVQAALSVGTDLLQRVTRNIVVMSSDDNGLNNEQGLARTNRRGQDSPFVRVAYILARKTVDDRQYRSLIDQAIARNKFMRKK